MLTTGLVVKLSVEVTLTNVTVLLLIDAVFGVEVMLDDAELSSDGTVGNVV